MKELELEGSATKPGTILAVKDSDAEIIEGECDSLKQEVPTVINNSV